MIPHSPLPEEKKMQKTVFIYLFYQIVAGLIVVPKGMPELQPPEPAKVALFGKRSLHIYFEMRSPWI